MDFALTEDQEALVGLFDGLFSREVPSTRVRDAEPTGFDAALWRLVADAGAVGIAVPEAAGGAGYSLLDAALVVERAGRVLAPVPLVDAVTTARLLARVGHPDLDPAPFAAGEQLGATALRPSSAGTARLVPGGAVADVVVGLDGDTLVAARNERPVTRPNLGGEPLADCALAGGTPLSSGEAARRLHEGALRDWRCLTAAAIVGAASSALDIAATYVTDRQQFGRPIGAFQAVAHGLADAATDIDGARLLAHEAAWAVDEDDPRAPALAGMALAFASDVANAAAATALHYHGGYGFMLEYDIQLHYRKIRSWTSAIGPADVELLRLADEIYGPRKEQD